MLIRPSAIARIVACRGSPRVSAGAPSWIDEYGDHAVREEGNAGHWLAHQNSQRIYPVIGALAPNGVVISQELQDGANMYLQAVAAAGCSDVRFEQRIEVIPAVSANCGGTPDAAGVGWSASGRPLIYIGDLKLGYRIVNVWPNYQLITYAAGIANLMGWQLSDCDVHLQIVQPRKWHRHGPVRSAFKSGSEVQAQVNFIRNAVAMAETDLAPLQPGEHCDYCPGRARCPALDARVSGVAFDMPNDLTTDQAERELDYLMQHKELLEARITGLSAQVDHAARTGQRLTRFERVAETKRAVWRDDDVERIRALGRLMGLPVEKPAELITPTQAKKLLPASVVDSYAHRPQGAFKLVKQDPSRWVEIFKGK